MPRPVPGLATLLLEYADQLKRAAAFFDFSKADTGGGTKKVKLPEIALEG